MNKRNMQALIHFIAVSTFLHLSWLYCIRDLHRYSVTSSSEMTPHFHNLNPPAGRVFMFAVTGLKLNYTYEVQEDSTSNMPFIRTVIRRQGRWGVMHSTSPTSRDTYHLYNPSNSYLTGVTQQEYYEDDVNYDSILNASSRSWVWSHDAHSFMCDNPNIESKIYKKGMNNVNCSTYNSWIFNSIEDLLLIHSNEKTVANKLNHSGSVFLANVDVSNCSQLQNDLKSLDQKINRTTDLVNSYFGDNRTTYLIFGIPEQLTELLPFIAWGAGIKQPRSAQYGDYRYNDNIDVNWNLQKFERIDLQMIDIAALVATLLGIRIPTHSQGTVPHGYIHYNKEFVAEALLSNAKQFMEKVNVAEQEIQSQSLPAFFRPYKPLTFPDRVMIVEKTQQLINQRKLQDVVENSLQVINKCKEALKYFKTYHHLSLKLSFALTSVGWIVYTVSILCREGNEETLHSFPSILCVIVCLVVFSLHYCHGVSTVYYIYHALPLLTWDLAVRKGKRIYRKIQKALENINQLVVNMVLLSFVLLGLQIIFLGLFHNTGWLLLLMMLIGCLVPFIALRRRNSIRFTGTWFMLCTLIGSYPLLPRSQTSLNAVLPPMVILLIIVLHVYLLCNPFLQYKLTRPRNRVCSTFNTLITDTLICLLTGLIAIGNTFELVTKDFSHLLSQIILATAALLLLFSPRSVPGRLLHTATLLIVVFNIVDGSSNIVYLFLLVSLLFFTLFMVDMDPKQNENAVGVLWNGMFGCLYFSDFPMRNTSVKDESRLPSINNAFRAGYFILLTLISITAVVGELDLISSNAFNLATYPFSYYTSSVSIVLCMKLILPVFCIYCVCSVIAVKYGVTSMDFACLSLLMMDIVALELFLFTNLITAFIIVVLNALFCPAFFSLARIAIGNSIIPRKTCDEPESSKMN